MQDIVVIQSLQERGFDFRNVTEALRYEAPEHLPRILDKPPKRISLRKAKDVPVYGCKQEFIMAYNDLLREVSSDVFSLDFKGNLKYCDKEVFVALQTLITQSLCKTKERAEACFELFRIISTAPFDTLTLERIYTTLSSYTTTSYYAGQLLEALHVCLFNTDSVILYYNQLIEYSGFYKTAFDLGRDAVKRNCKTEKDVERYLRMFYNEAKADKDFMKHIYKPGANKWLIAVIYLLKDEHPEVLEPNNSNVGFA